MDQQAITFLRERVLRAGDVQILDLAQPNVTEAKASGTIAIVVPRDTLRRARLIGFVTVL